MGARLVEVELINGQRAIEAADEPHIGVAGATALDRIGSTWLTHESVTRIVGSNRGIFRVASVTTRAAHVGVSVYAIGYLTSWGVEPFFRELVVTTRARIRALGLGSRGSKVPHQNQ